MPILPNGSSTKVEAPSGGSPRGWTFISTSIECWRKWAFRHVYGLYPVETSDALLLGSAYHALMEGKTLQEVSAAYPKHVGTAVELQRRRLAGPPLPANSEAVIEKEFNIFNGLMTSKPDRLEKQNGKVIVRDFKTASSFSDSDEEAWGADGGILGECIAGKTDTAIVDIVLKYQPKSGGGVKLVTVKLTKEKELVLKETVRNFWQQAEERVKQAAKPGKGDLNAVLANAFPQQLKSCVGKYGKCPYYARCWQKGTADSMLYRSSDEPPFRWAKHAGGIDWQKHLDKAYELGKKGV